MDPVVNIALSVTGKLDDAQLWGLPSTGSTVQYRLVPHRTVTDPTLPVWRVRLEPTFDSTQCIGLDVNGDVALGRVEGTDDCVSLNALNADQLGVSRRHAILRPTGAKLFVIDTGSTNGTFLNGHSIGVNTPYSLSNGDLLSLGKLEFSIKIIHHPSSTVSVSDSKATFTDLLLPALKAITSQLSMTEALKQTLEMSVALTKADEATLWLVDENSGELFLRAQHGMAYDSDTQLRLPVTDTLAGKVIETGKSLHVNRAAGSEQIKVKTGYLVEAVIYVPLTLGGITFGVLSAAHHANGKVFSTADEALLQSIADFTAIAVQNARVYDTLNQNLIHRTKLLTALNSVLSYDLKKLLKAGLGYAGMLQSFLDLDADNTETLNNLIDTSSTMSHIIDKLLEAVALNDSSMFHFAPCDLVDVVARAIDDTQSFAWDKSIKLDLQVIGDAYPIQGDESFLYRAALNLLNNAIEFTPDSGKVTVTLAFTPTNVVIRVRDTGCGIPNDYLPELFNKYFRSKVRSDGHGLGLGLEIARATAEAHRGTIIARNVEGSGAEVLITLPGTLRVN